MNIDWLRYSRFFHGGRAPRLDPVISCSNSPWLEERREIPRSENGKGDEKTANGKKGDPVPDWEEWKRRKKIEGPKWDRS